MHFTAVVEFFKGVNGAVGAAKLAELAMSLSPNENREVSPLTCLNNLQTKVLNSDLFRFVGLTAQNDIRVIVDAAKTISSAGRLKFVSEPSSCPAVAYARFKFLCRHDDGVVLTGEEALQAKLEAFNGLKTLTFDEWAHMNTFRYLLTSGGDVKSLIDLKKVAGQVAQTAVDDASVAKQAATSKRDAAISFDDTDGGSNSKTPKHENSISQALAMFN